MDQESINKYHPFFSVLIGVAFLVALQSAASPRLNLALLCIVSFVLSACVFVYNRWYLGLLKKYSPWLAIRQPLLIISGTGLFLVAPTPFLRGIFLLASVVVLTFFELVAAAFSENLLLNETLFTAFALFTGFGGWAFLYTPAYRFYISLLVFIFIFLLARSFFEYVPQNDKTKLVSSLALALFASEIFWAAGFLPQHYTSLALALTALFYAVLSVNYHYLFNNLDFKKIQFYVLIACACVLLVFLSTPWKIVN